MFLLDIFYSNGYAKHERSPRALDRRRQSVVAYTRYDIVYFCTRRPSETKQSED